ncbi:MAG: response regulator [Nitrospinae bacterium]|nr:response regulator [Nitrospinota bacterium]
MMESKKARILYMEDDLGLGRLLQKRLEKEGYAVTVAPDGEQGLALHHDHPFDLLLIDNSLPGSSGLNIIRDLGSQPSPPPMIMVTGTGDEKIAVKAMKLGASDYIVKDVDGRYLELLSTVIEEALFRKRLAMEKEAAVTALTQSEQRLKQNLTQLQEIVKGTGSDTGEIFFRSLVRHLASALNARYSFIGELVGEAHDTIQVLAVWSGEEFGKNFQYPLADTPCANVVGRQACYYPHRVKQKFPKDVLLTRMNIECYLGVPLFDSSGAPLGLLSVMHDQELIDPKNAQSILSIFASRAEAEIERQRVEQDLIAAKIASEKANQAKSEFLSRMSHELRTPMNAILGFGQLLKMDPHESLSKEDQKSVDFILEAGKHLMDLIDEVLDLSRIESGKLQLAIERVQVDQITEEVLNMILPLAEKHGIRINNHISKIPGLQVLADRVRFKQVMFNLLSNAIKYNRAQGTITLEAEHTARGTVRLHIADTGLGIAREKQKDLFEPFNRLDAHNTEIQGTGIGLAITKRLMALMNGSIEVESTLGKGSRFSVEFPKI